MLVGKFSTFKAIDVPENIRGFLLDLDNTLYEYEPCHKAGLKAAQTILEKYNGPLNDFDTRYKTAQKLVKSRIPNCAASHSRILYFQTILEAMACNSISTVCTKAHLAYWQTFMNTMKLRPGVRTFLHNTKKQGKNVVIITDLTADIQHQKIAKLGIDHLIDGVVTSEEIGVEKPDPKIFNLALKKVRCTPKETCVIGDDYKKDIQGAIKLGMPAIQITYENS